MRFECKEVAEESKDTSDGNFDGEFGVAEDSKHGGDAGDNVGQNDGGSDMVLDLKAGEDEDAGTYDAAHSEPYEVPPRERLLHLVLASPLQFHQLHLLIRPPRHSIRQPPRRRQQRSPVL